MGGEGAPPVGECAGEGERSTAGRARSGADRDKSAGGEPRAGDEENEAIGAVIAEEADGRGGDVVAT